MWTYLPPSRSFPNISANTEKLELPSLTHVHSRGPAQWVSASAPPRSSLLSGDRLPTLPLRSTPPSRGGSFDSSASAYPPSLTSSGSSYPNFDPQTPSPSEGRSPHHYHCFQAPAHVKEHPHTQSSTVTLQATSNHHSANNSSVMNPSQPYLDASHSHMTTGPSYGTLNQTAGTGAMSQYPHYQPQTNVPPAASGPYAPTGPPYGSYYGGVTSPQPAGGSTPVSMGMHSLPSLGQQPSPIQALTHAV